VKALLQRVSSARVEVAGEIVGAIDAGLLVFVGIEPDDTPTQADWLADRVVGLRVFADADQQMNRSLVDAGGAVLAVSQFTLAADTRRGRRPGFSTAASPELARPLFDAFVAACRERVARVETGRFGADMQVHLVNDGPVTFTLETRRDG
jgi:D-tyrosyl-tRNA(Tyr) deacylase